MIKAPVNGWVERRISLDWLTHRPTDENPLGIGDVRVLINGQVVKSARAGDDGVYVSWGEGFGWFVQVRMANEQPVGEYSIRIEVAGNDDEILVEQTDVLRIVDSQPVDVEIKTTSPIIAEQRLETCKGCEAFEPKRGMCNDCGCYMPEKVKLAAALCPRGVWDA